MRAKRKAMPPKPTMKLKATLKAKLAIKPKAKRKAKRKGKRKAEPTVKPCPGPPGIIQALPRDTKLDTLRHALVHVVDVEVPSRFAVDGVQYSLSQEDCWEAHLLHLQYVITVLDQPFA